MRNFNAILSVFLLAGIVRAETATMTVPTAEVVCKFNTHDKEMPKTFKIGQGFQRIGDYLYVTTPMDGVVQYFKWHAQTSKISYVDSITNPAVDGQTLCAAGGRLYGLGLNVDPRPFREATGFTWYDIEKETGKPIVKGSIPEIGGWGNLIAGPDEKDLYFVGSGIQIYWMKIGADGTPAKSAGFAGAGIRGNLRMSPDGKNIYSINEGRIGIVDRQPTGEIAYKKAIPLNVPVTDPDAARLDSASTIAGISPDGRWLYIEVYSGHPRTPCHFNIFKRDPETGDLVFSEGGSDFDPKYNKLATLPFMNLIFAPDGKSGFISTGGDLLQTFRYDEKTGHLTDITSVIVPTDKFGPCLNVSYDPKNNLLFGLGWWQHYAYGDVWNGFWVAKTGTAPAPQRDRSDIKTTRAAADAKVTNSDDWPCWRGIHGDGKSPLKGIRKDWTGGLKEVWRVSGLSPVSATWSAPAIKGDKLVVLGKHGWTDEALCFDADKGGEPLWVTQLPGTNGGDSWAGGPTATPYIDGDKVYLSQSNHYVCLNLADGKVIWKRNSFSTGHAPGHSPLVWEDLVILPNVITPDNKWPWLKQVQLCALNKNTGEQVWGYQENSKLRFESYTSPLLLKIDGKDQVVYTATGYACGVDPRSGKPFWEYVLDPKYTTGGLGSPAPLTDGSNLVVSPGFRIAADPASEKDKIPAVIKIENGQAKTVWDGEYRNMWSAGILKNGFVYSFCSDGLYNGARSTFRCVDLLTGTPKWVQANTGSGSLVEVDDCLLCLTYGGDLWLLNPTPDGFKKITEWTVPLKHENWVVAGAPDIPILPFWTVPVIAHGRLYVRYSDVMICYDLLK